MQANWDADRINLFRAEITKLFMAFNKPFQKNLIDAKSELTAETLSTLRTDKIQEFFKFVRSAEDTLPNDGVLKKILSSNYQRFARVSEAPARLTPPSNLPSDEWLKEYWIRMKKVLAGGLTTTEAWAELEKIN